MCGIHSAGKYDHTKGGHLVLKEAKLIIQFPPGCLIFIPSAVITHGNTPIQAGETRVSFTQYSSGAFFRYFENGFCTQAQLKKRNKKRYREVLKAKETRWETGLGLWSTVDEILNRGKANASTDSEKDS